jgi:hypothetical protein
MTVAIIGTAGRDPKYKMTADLWRWMANDAIQRASSKHLVSGGAAWADHLAVGLFLNGHAKSLVLHLPAPFVEGRFVGPHRSSGSTANYYHDLFSAAIGQGTLDQIRRAIAAGARVTEQPAAEGYVGMYARNRLVAQAETMIAYTFAEGAVPADGGTYHTWCLHVGSKVHVTLPRF